MPDTEAPDTQARSLGWVPQEEFRGDPEKWVDAETFVERGKQIMPILRANNKRLQDQLASQAAELQSVKSLLTASAEAIDELKRFHSEDAKAKMAAVKQQVLEQLRSAKEAGNVDDEVRLTDQLTDIKAAQKAEPPPAKKVEPPADQPDPAFIAWQQQPENSWFGRDMRKTSLALGIAQELRNDPANANLVGQAFFKRVADEAEETLNPSGRKSSKVEGSRGGAGGPGGSDRAKGYGDLPPDAKAACEDMARRLVGDGRAFKVKADWQKHYAQVYFSGEE
jgi:hypothetical protein